MTNRVVLGDRGSDVGLFISKPGVNVLTASPGELLFSSGMRAFQLVQSGRVSFSSSTTISIPDLGYNPLVLTLLRLKENLSVNQDTGYIIDVRVEYLSATSIRLTKYIEGIDTDGTLTYAIIRTPYDG